MYVRVQKLLALRFGWLKKIWFSLSGTISAAKAANLRSLFTKVRGCSNRDYTVCAKVPCLPLLLALRATLFTTIRKPSIFSWLYFVASTIFDFFYNYVCV